MNQYEVWKALPATENDDEAEILVSECETFVEATKLRDLLMEEGWDAWIEDLVWETVK